MFGMGMGAMGLTRLGRGGGGAPPLVITYADPLFFDDFDGAEASMTGRTGWTPAGDLTKAGKMKVSDGMARMTTNFNGQSPYGYQVTTATPSVNRRVEFEYDYSQQGSTISDPTKPYQYLGQRFYVAWQDENNNTYFQMTPASSRLTVFRVVGGTQTEAIRFDGVPATGTVAVEIVGDRVRVYHNGKLCHPSQLYGDALSAFPDRKLSAGSIVSGAVAMRHEHQPLILSKYVKVIDLDVVRINDLKGFYGRDATGKRTVTVSGAYSGSPTGWVYRVRKYSDGSVVKDWASLSVSASAGTWSADITFDTGGPNVVDVGWIGSDGKTQFATSSPFSVGILVCYWGQSLAAGMAGVGGTVTAVSDRSNGFNSSSAHASSSYRDWINAGVVQFGSTAGYQIAAMALSKGLADLTGVPVGITATGVAATQLALLKPGTDNWNNVLVPLISEIGGNVECWVWSQGESEGLSLSDYSNYVTDFGLLIDGFRSIGGRADASVHVRMIGRSGTTSTTEETIRAQAVRSILLSLPTIYSNVHMGCAVLGVPYADVIHPTVAGARTLATREALSLAKNIYAANAYDGLGPMVTGATRSGTTITLALDLNGATSVSGTALTGYVVSADDFATTLTISSGAVSGNSIVLTLAADPGTAVKVRSFNGKGFDDTSLALGTYADGTTIPVFPIINPITAI